MCHHFRVESAHPLCTQDGREAGQEMLNVLPPQLSRPPSPKGCSVCLIQSRRLSPVLRWTSDFRSLHTSPVDTRGGFVLLTAIWKG